MPPIDPAQNAASSSASLNSAASAVGRSALRQASWRLIPLIGIAYGVAYTDRVNISFAALQMNRDLHFSASAYGLGAGLFFLSYAACEIPSNLLLARFGARRWIARIMFTWGLLAAGMMFVRTPLSSVVMGAIAGALLGLQGRMGLAGWQWLFLAEGLPALLLSAAFFFFLPNTPADAKWLSADERDWLVEQLRADHPGAGSSREAGKQHSHAGGVFRAIFDRRVLQLGGLLFCLYIGDYAVKFTAPLIIQQITSLGNTGVGFVIAGLGLLAALAMVLNGMDSDRTNERYLHIAVPVLLMVVAFVVSGASVAPGVALPAFAILFAGFSATGGPVWVIPSSFLTGRNAAAGIATVNMIAILGGFVGPYWMGLAKDWTGNFQTGLLTLAIPEFAGLCIILHMWRQVRKRPTSL